MEKWPGNGITGVMNTRDTERKSKGRGSEGMLFELPAGGATEPEGAGQARVRCAQRHQVEMICGSLDSLLPEEHRARVVWEYVQGLELSALYQKIRSVEGGAGRDAIDPKILMTLWLYATLEGVGSARQFAKLCTEHIAYRWICGGQRTNYHTLSDFRTAHPEVLDELLTRSVATLMHEGLVTLKRVAQDGERVRASAGASSFRRRKTLQECQRKAEERIKQLRQELEDDPGACSRRQQAARQRAARERKQRIDRALKELDEIEANKSEADKDKARASTTDADTRVMKMGDGGFRPAQNVQFATDTESQVITGVDVTNSGGDQGQMAPMVEQHEQRYQQTPKEMLVDGGFVKKEDIEEVSEPNGNTTVYSPVMQSKSDNRDPHTPRDDDSPVIAAWRKRMATDEAKLIYRERASTAECVNAIARNRGMQQFRVRGRPKVLAVVLLYTLTHNIMRTAALRAATETKAA